MFLVGLPGAAGKTLLARALSGNLPEMSIEESLDVTRIYSIANQLPPGTSLIRNVPSALLICFHMQVWSVVETFLSQAKSHYLIEQAERNGIRMEYLYPRIY